MKISVHNRQSKRRPNIRKLAALAHFFMRLAVRRNPASCWNNITVVLTDHVRIAALNRVFLNKTADTDVIAFQSNPVPGFGTGVSGEIHLDVERAIEAGKYRGGATGELALYLAHGCDHLTGADDRTVRQRRRMRRRELRWICRARQAGLMEGLWGRNAE